MKTFVWTWLLLGVAATGADFPVNLIDRHIFPAIQAAGVTPALKSDDYEFLRRVTLDLTGRIPTVERVLAFAADPSPDKRERRIEELLASPEWIDKWTQYYNDLFRNSEYLLSNNAFMYPEGRDAFYGWVHDAVAKGKPYDQMARELISATGTTSYIQGEVNWLILNKANTNYVQDIWDQQTSAIATTFLGISHVNCLLCHDGRRHLDAISLWGGNSLRTDAWGLASFLSRSEIKNVPTNLPGPLPTVFWWIEDDKRFTADYPLDTTEGCRPPRQPVKGLSRIAPVYPFNGRGPLPGETYRNALGREVTGDFQFARAAVNYVWKELFTIGIVDPADQFDPARLDPDNPPPFPWTLQPSDPRLLNELARDFIDHGYDLRSLFRRITTSDTYQLSSRYPASVRPADWNPAWNRLFARKLPRRLWGEEVADALSQSSNIATSYDMVSWKFPWKPVETYSQAMKMPEPSLGQSTFLPNFLVGDRDGNPRSGVRTAFQSLTLMNDPLVLSKLATAGGRNGPTLLQQALAQDDRGLVTTLWLSVLSRPPQQQEINLALNQLSAGDRTSQAQDLLWSLYNKLEFILSN